VVRLPNEAPEDREPAAQGHRRSLFNHGKRPIRTCLAESGQLKMAARSTKRGNATGSCRSSEEKDAGHKEEEEDPKPHMVTSSSVRIVGNDPDEEVVPEKEEEDATTSVEIPAGWTRVKLEPSSPDNRKRPRTCVAENGYALLLFHGGISLLKVLIGIYESTR
jgi:hypothetical protein